MLFAESLQKSTKGVKWIQHGAKRKPNDAQRERNWRQVDPKGLQKGAIWPPKKAKGRQNVAKSGPKGTKRELNGLQGSCVKTNEIRWNVVLKHKGGKLGSTFVL